LLSLSLQSLLVSHLDRRVDVPKNRISVNPRIDIFIQLVAISISGHRRDRLVTSINDHHNNDNTMSTVLEAIWDRRDIRVDDWPLMSSPLPTLLLCSAYFYIVKIWGPQFMRDRKPYELKNTLIAYNVVQASRFCCCNCICSITT
jgi:hypothetical protein